MTRYVASRTGQAVLVLLGVYTGSFMLLYLLPSNALAILILNNSGGADVSLSSEELAEATAQAGLAGTWFEQYRRLLFDAFKGDFGTSIATGAEVSALLADALPHTLQLAALALLVALIVGVGGGYAIAGTRSRRIQTALLMLPPLSVAIPTFTVGLVLMNWLAFSWGVLPSGGNDGALALIMPSLTLAIPTAAIIAQVFSKSLLAQMRSPYAETAYAKGAVRRQVLLSHATRNAVAPTLAISGIVMGSLLGGSVVVETVFYRNGLGRLTVNSVLAQDSPVVLAVALLSAAVFVFVNLLVDISLPIIDRRIGWRS